jgi:hypothetical protein
LIVSQELLIAVAKQAAQPELPHGWAVEYAAGVSDVSESHDGSSVQVHLTAACHEAPSDETCLEKRRVTVFFGSDGLNVVVLSSELY